MKTLTGMMFCVVVAMFAVCAGVGMGSKPTEHRPPEPRADAATHAEQTRQLQDLMRAGYFDRLDGGTIAKLWVCPAFYGLSFEDKQACVAVAYCVAWRVRPGVLLTAEDNGAELLYLHDVQSGKRVGVFSFTGLRME